MPCPIGGDGAQTAPTLEDGRCLACAAIEVIYYTPPQHSPPPTLEERNALICAQHAAGISQAELARQFGLSYQRIHQIVHDDSH